MSLVKFWWPLLGSNADNKQYYKHTRTQYLRGSVKVTYVNGQEGVFFISEFSNRGYKYNSPEIRLLTKDSRYKIP